MACPRQLIIHFIILAGIQLKDFIRPGMQVAKRGLVLVVVV